MVSLNFLKKHELFTGITDTNLSKIRSMMTAEYFPKNTVIMQEGDKGYQLYFIEKGSVEILKTVPGIKARQQETIATLKAGSSFGEMELFDKQPRVATVRALTDTTVLTLTNLDLFHLAEMDLKTFTILILNMARAISLRLRKMDEVAAISLFSSLEITKAMESQ